MGTMKLVFPGGEHPQVLLGQGINRVGSDPGSTIVINRPGVLPQHCQLHVTATGVMVDVPVGTTVSVNGRQVSGLIALRPGDTVAFDQVQARLAAMETVPAAALNHVGPAASLPQSANDDPGVTAIRPILPKYVLRGVSGVVFGRNIPLLVAATIGRSHECTLQIDEPGLSRVHARAIPTDDGVQLEDQGSTNGTYINGKRVVRGVARAGDEIGFDTIRFRLTASNQAESAPENVPVSSKRRKWPWLVAGLAVVLLAAAGAAVLMR
jgi:pSer/pThr/pTyr-binding forkhead associated (FHA) protein